MKKYFISLLLPIIIFCLSCGGSLNYNNLSNLIDLGVDWLLGNYIESKLKSDDAHIQYVVWSAVNQSLDEFVLPVLNGDNPQIKDLESWVDHVNLWSQIPISNLDIEILQKVINLMLSYIPANKWVDVQQSGKIRYEVNNLLKSGFNSMKSVITKCLDRYKYLEVITQTENTEINVIEHTIKLEFNYAK